MPRTPQAPLCFDLIKSLDRPEKIHFKRYLSHQSGKGEPAIYVKLFDELDKMKDYDAERLKRKFNGEKFINHLSASFKYLYDSLLISLVNYHTKKDDELIADEMLGEIRVLFQKRLYKHCARLIRNARKFYEKREYHRHLYALGAYEYNLTVREMQQDEIGELKRITKERRAYLRKLDDELLIVDLREQLTRYHREKQLNPNRNFKTEIRDVGHKLEELEAGFEIGTTTFKLCYMRAKGLYHYIKNQPIESLRAEHRYVRLRRDLPHPHGVYLTAMSNHITKAVEIWFVDEVEYWLPELEKIPAQTRNLEHRADSLNWHFRFQTFLMRGQFDELADWVKKLMGELDILLKKNVAYYQVLLFEDLALYHFLIGDFQESREWIDRIFRKKDTDDWVRKFTVNMKLLEIMTHFNLENYEIIPSFCRNFERFAKKLQHAENEFIKEISWAKKMKRLENYMLPRQMNDFIKTLLLESYFAIPPNYRLVLMSVWAQAHHNNISLRESWAQHAKNILTEMKSVTGMEVLCFESEKSKI